MTPRRAKLLKTKYVTPDDKRASSSTSTRNLPGPMTGVPKTSVNESKNKKKRSPSLSNGNPAKSAGSNGAGAINGRNRKKVVRKSEVERRRARDDKFGLGPDGFEGMVSAFTMT